MLILVKNNCHIIALLVVISGALIAATNTSTPSTFAQVQAPICPASHVQHWDKIVFFIKSPNLAGSLHLVPETEYDIKVAHHLCQYSEDIFVPMIESELYFL